MIKKEELPKFVELNDKTIIINIPENPIGKNVSIEKFEIENGKLKIILGLN
jgi:aspartate/methionine/tyrosine aminotransferase